MKLAERMRMEARVLDWHVKNSHKSGRGYDMQCVDLRDLLLEAAQKLDEYEAVNGPADTVDA